MDSSASDLSAADSTAKLLQDLHLVGRKHHAKAAFPSAYQMDTMEMDLILEVPDTPDRLVMVRPVEDVGKEATKETYHQSGSNLSFYGQKTSSYNALDNESLFRKARLASLKSKPHDSEVYRIEKKFPLGISYPTRCRNPRRKMTRDLHGEKEASCSDQLRGGVSCSSGPIRRTHNVIANSSKLSVGAHGSEGSSEIAVAKEDCSMSWVAESNCNDSGISLAIDSQAIIEKAASKPHPRRYERRRLVRNGLISPNNIREKFPSINEESSSHLVERSSLDKGKGIDLSDNSQNKSKDTLFQAHWFDNPRKNCGQRRLVQNGCSSPFNIPKNRNLTGWKRDGIGNSGEVEDGCSLPELQVVSPDSESRQADEMKEGVFQNDVIQANGQDAKSSFMSSRELLLPDEERIVNAKAFADVWPADDTVWRRMHTQTGETAERSSQETSVVSDRRDDSFHSSDQQRGSVLDVNLNVIPSVYGSDSWEAPGPSWFTNESNLSEYQGSAEEGHYGAERLTRGKRKSRSKRTLRGECSNSPFTESDASHPHLSGEVSNAKSMSGCSSQRHGVALGPIIDVDELPSPVLRSANGHNGSCISSESVTRAHQVESDEMLARQLQEQFFNESSFGGSEIDATIAWTLQQEEDAQRTSFVRNHGLSHPRNPSIAHLYRQYPRQSSHNSSVRSTSRARITPSARMPQLRRNMRREMDLEARLNYLEALEVAFNNANGVRSDILQVQRDFNELIMSKKHVPSASRNPPLETPSVTCPAYINFTETALIRGLEGEHHAQFASQKLHRRVNKSLVLLFLSVLLVGSC